MKSINKKLISASILIFALILLLSTIVHAKPFTEAFRGGLIQINDFFVSEQYKVYAKAIDFFFFSLLFIPFNNHQYKINSRVYKSQFK